jgi:cell division protease FtsH
MVTQYGMSDNLGPIQYGRGTHQVFLGRDIGEERNYSEAIASKIDVEVRTIIDGCYGSARHILDTCWPKVERMVSSLLEHETVEGEEIAAILGDYPFPRPAAEPKTLPLAASVPADEPQRIEKPKRLPNITPEPA